VPRQQQDEYRASSVRTNRTDLDLVFATPEGDYLKPDSVTAKRACSRRSAG